MNRAERRAMERARNTGADLPGLPAVTPHRSAFAPGDRVVWHQKVRGGYSLSDGSRTLGYFRATVVSALPKRVKIRLDEPMHPGHVVGEVRYVMPRNLHQAWCPSVDERVK